MANKVIPKTIASQIKIVLELDESRMKIQKSKNEYKTEC